MLPDGMRGFLSLNSMSELELDSSVTLYMPMLPDATRELTGVTERSVDAPETWRPRGVVGNSVVDRVVKAGVSSC